MYYLLLKYAFMRFDFWYIGFKYWNKHNKNYETREISDLSIKINEIKLMRREIVVIFEKDNIIKYSYIIWFFLIWCM